MRGGARVLPGARCFRGAARRRFAQPFGGALAPLGSPPFRRRGASSVQLFGRGVLPRLFFLTAARKTGAARLFLAWSAAVFGVGGAAVLGGGGSVCK